nr:DEAD/DEAH box helicase [uncultured Novosphingobium sp.]
MIDPFLRFVNCVDAYRMHTFALNEGLGGALGVAADPLPHQLATVRRMLSEAEIRHLISDEVGLGKTVQALMIVNALRFQDPTHRTLIVVPDNLLSQWQDECWTKGHVMPALVGASDFDIANLPSVTLVRPRDLTIRDDEGGRIFQADSQVFDLLIVDEPQTMPRDAVQTVSQIADGFRQVLVLSATPRLGDAAWRNMLMRILEPEIAQLAQLQDKTIDGLLEEREAAAATQLLKGEDALPLVHAKFAAGRRIVRNSRSDWNDRLPRRRNHAIRVQPLHHERLRIEIACALVRNVDPRLGFEGPQWTAAKSLQRSARAARVVLAEIAARGGELSELARTARQLTLDDPGDARLGALLDILASQWESDSHQTFIVVCGDNPTIDLLQTALPKYFPELDNAISVLRRPSSGEVDRVTNLREMQATLAPLNSGENRLLLVGDWVQAGLNLHQVSSGIIFYSLPWEVDSIDQLIGRIDRLGGGRADAHGQRWIDIWRILVEGAQETAVADCMVAMGVFDSPLPPLSPEQQTDVQELLAQTAIEGSCPHTVSKLTAANQELPSGISLDAPANTAAAKELYATWQQTDHAHQSIRMSLAGHTPVARKESAINIWLKTMDRAGDFDVGRRIDKIDSYRFKALWYPRQAASGRPGQSPFLLPGVNHDRWMSDHLPFISRRSHVSSPPRRTVLTDEGEDTPRPLHFLDNGSPVFDALVGGYCAAAASTFGQAKRLTQSIVMVPEGHPALAIGSTVLLSAAQLDPFPDELLPGLWSTKAKELLAAAPTEAQRSSLLADRKGLMSRWRAVQRAVRLAAPARLVLVGSAHGREGWRMLSREQIETCLQPFSPPDWKAVARGRLAAQPLVKQDLVDRLEVVHRDLVAEAATRFHEDAVECTRSILEILAAQTSTTFEAQLRNRKLAAERRRNGRPQGVPEELWLGQVAALDRLSASSEINSVEVPDLICRYQTGELRPGEPQTISILAGLRAID